MQQHGSDSLIAKSKNEANNEYVFEFIFKLPSLSNGISTIGIDTINLVYLYTNAFTTTNKTKIKRIVYD